MADLRRELATALIGLTRLPVGRWVPVPLAQAVWAFPLVGLIVGLCGGLGLWLAGGLGLPPLAMALIALAAMALATGALHEDGLADYADGCGGSTRARALDIMRDSRIGSYGVLALILGVGLKAAALAELARNPGDAVLALVGAAAISRAGMALGLRWMRPARPDGLGRQAGRPSRNAVAWAGGLGVALLLPLGLGAAVTALGATAAVQLLVARHAHRRLGGQTGDVLGALQQSGEIAALLALSASLPGMA